MKYLHKKSRTSFYTALMFVLGISSTIAQADEKHEADKKYGARVTTVDIEWQLSPFGPEIWSVDGDLLLGKHITYIKFAAGTITPVHIHSARYVGIVVTGITRHWVPGKDETKKLLPPGSHWEIPANQEHVSECLSGVECVMAIIQDQAFDFIPLRDAPIEDDAVEAQ